MSIQSIIFVHGANHGSWCWELMRPLLSAPFASLDLPGRGMFPLDPAEIEIGAWVDHVCNAITGPDLHDVILVGHSLAGITLPRVVDRIPDRIAHVVYVAAAVPAAGESIADMVLDGKAPPATVGPPEDAAVRAAFCNDMDERQTKFVLERLVPEAGRPFAEPMDLAGLAHPVPRTFVKLLRDQSLRPQLQDEVIERLAPVNVVELDTGHDVMISKPQALAPILNALTKKN
ncbi:MAG: alpha/beta fold hydrolase [Candidatus Binatia bacterium]|nr:alpha/beta fold hydrolase [Candidatus Binatia bacterium]